MKTSKRKRKIAIFFAILDSLLIIGILFTGTHLADRFENKELADNVIGMSLWLMVFGLVGLIGFATGKFEKIES
jgi:hypothetical protein